MSDPQLDSIRTFIGVVAPYFGDIVKSGPFQQLVMEDSIRASYEGKRVREQLAVLNQLLVFPRGVRDYRERALAALHAISENHHHETRSPAVDQSADQDAVTSDGAIVAAFRKWALDTTGAGAGQERSYPYLALTRRTLQAFLPLDTAARNLRAKLPVNKTDSLLLKTADSVLSVADAIVSAVYSTQQIAAAAKVAAKSTDPAITPRVVVTENGAQDNRGVYAVSFGLGIPLARDWTLVVPNALVSPTTDVKAFGIGGALNWRWISFGVGGVAVRHIDYLTPTNTPLDDATLLQTRTRYGRMKLFYSVALTGIPGVPSSAH